MLPYLKRAKPIHLQPRRCSQAQEPLWASISPHKCIDQKAAPSCPKHTQSADGGWFIVLDLILQEVLVLPPFSPKSVSYLPVLWTEEAVCYGGNLRHWWWGNRSHPSLQIWLSAHKPLNKTFCVPCKSGFARALFIPHLLLWECPSLMNKSPKSPSSGCFCSIFVYHSSESCLPGFSWAPGLPHLSHFLKSLFHSPFQSDSL